MLPLSADEVRAVFDAVILGGESVASYARRTGASYVRTLSRIDRIRMLVRRQVRVESQIDEGTRHRLEELMTCSMHQPIRAARARLTAEDRETLAAAIDEVCRMLDAAAAVAERSLEVAARVQAMIEEAGANASAEQRSALLALLRSGTGPGS